MRKEMSTEELEQVLSTFLDARCIGVDPEEMNLRFCPTVETCNGPLHSATFRFHTYPWMSNPMNVTHGGIITAILDSSMGILCTAFYNGMTPTITMTTNYCRPVPLDTDVLVKVQLSHFGGTSAQLSAWMYLDDELFEPLATATGVYYTAHTKKPKE